MGTSRRAASSQWSRQQAHQIKTPTFGQKTPEQYAERWRSLDELIERNEKQLAKLQVKLFSLPPLSAEASRARGQCSIKKDFLERLYRERETGEQVRLRIWRPRS